MASPLKVGSRVRATVRRYGQIVRVVCGRVTDVRVGARGAWFEVTGPRGAVSVREANLARY
jgi:hypothetical protein